MNEWVIIKSILERFMLCVTVCAVLLIVVSGKITVEQSADQIISGASFASVSLENGEKKLELRAGDRSFSLDKGKLQTFLEIKKEIALTPLGAFLKDIKK